MEEGKSIVNAVQYSTVPVHDMSRLILLKSPTNICTLLAQIYSITVS